MSATTPLCTVSIPGPRGAPGADGADGADGQNAFTTMQLDAGAPVAIPAWAANATIFVSDSSWAVPTQVIYIEFAGYYQVVTIVDSTHITVTNLGYPGNINAVGNFANLARVGPAGLRGAAGANGTNGSTVVFPTTTKGDIIVDDGVASPHVVRVGTGTDGQAVVSDAATASGKNNATITPNTATDNAIVRFNGTTGKPVPAQNSAMLVTDDGDLQISTGNAKGTNATDLQSQRSGVTRVAAGIRAVIGGGKDNLCSGQDAVIAGGNNNESSGQGSAVGGGEGNIANGQDSCVPGGAGCGAIGDYSIATGRFGYTSAGGYGGNCHSAGRYGVTGDVGVVQFYMRNVTADNTPTELFLDGAAIRLVIGGSTTWAITGTLLGEKDDGTSKMWKFEGVLKKWPGTALVAAITPSVVAADAGAAAWAFTVTADAGNNSLKLEVTGDAAVTNIRWHAHVLLNFIGWY